MNIVLLESLGISEDVLKGYAEKIKEAGHNFYAYEKTTDVEKLTEEAKDADVLILANMPLPGEVILACNHLKYIDVAFTGVDHVDLEAARKMGVSVSNASGYSNDAVAELTLCMVLTLLRNVREVEKECRQGGTKEGLVGSELRERQWESSGPVPLAQEVPSFAVHLDVVRLHTMDFHTRRIQKR